MKLQDAIKSDRFKNARHRATLNIMYTAYWFKARISAVLKELGLTSEQFNTLRILKGKHPESMCVKDIGSRILEKSSNVPRIIDRLVVKKLVKRTTSKEDKRESLISLTAEGLRQLEKANKAVDTISEAITGIDEAEARQLDELLEKMRKTD